MAFVVKSMLSYIFNTVCPNLTYFSHASYECNTIYVIELAKNISNYYWNICDTFFSLQEINESTEIELEICAELIWNINHSVHTN